MFLRMFEWCLSLNHEVFDGGAAGLKKKTQLGNQGSEKKNIASSTCHTCFPT